VSDRLALANAIEDAGIPRDKAERLASVLLEVRPDLATTGGGSLLQAHQLSLEEIHALLAVPRGGQVGSATAT
jgi:hypothetical protein